MASAVALIAAGTAVDTFQSAYPALGAFQPVTDFVGNVNFSLTLAAVVAYEVTVVVLSKGYGRSTLDADEYDCDHIFLDGRRRSPAGKAIFGDWISGSF